MVPLPVSVQQPWEQKAHVPKGPRDMVAVFLAVMVPVVEMGVRVWVAWRTPTEGREWRRERREVTQVELDCLVWGVWQ